VGIDIACIGADTVPIDVLGGGLERWSSGEDVRYARIQVPCWCLFCLAAGLVQAVQCPAKVGDAGRLSPGSQGDCYCLQAKPLSHSRPLPLPLFRIIAILFAFFCLSSAYPATTGVATSLVYSRYFHRRPFSPSEAGSDTPSIRIPVGTRRRAPCAQPSAGEVMVFVVARAINFACLDSGDAMRVCC